MHTLSRECCAGTVTSIAKISFRPVPGSGLPHACYLGPSTGCLRGQSALFFAAGRPCRFSADPGCDGQLHAMHMRAAARLVPAGLSASHQTPLTTSHCHASLSVLSHAGLSTDMRVARGHVALACGAPVAAGHCTRPTSAQGVGFQGLAAPLRVGAPFPQECTCQL